jgi:calcineurin-like phosphoesterase family protein
MACSNGFMTVFFTSDTHFGDPRILRIDRRPFSSLAAHDAALIDRWNEVVSPNDEIWHLGDFALGPSDRILEILAVLNGSKHLIIGNNDGPATLSASEWVSIQHYKEITLEGAHLVLCHYPFRTWNRMGRGVIDLHGHSHAKLKPITRQFDVGVDAFDYRPVTLSTILNSRRNRRVAQS